jgi:hypothetical protein
MMPFGIKGTHTEVSGQFVSVFVDVFRPAGDIDL